MVLSESANKVLFSVVVIGNDGIPNSSSPMKKS